MATEIERRPSATSDLSAAIAQLPHWKLTVEQYQAMGRAGILSPDDRVELLEGELIAMAAMGGPHVAGVHRCNKLFSKRFADEAIISVQCAVRLPSGSEPEPDIALLRPQRDFYASGLPTPADILLVVEVADSSYDRDINVKLLLYARAGVTETWILDVGRDQLEAYSEPSAGGYRLHRLYRRGETIAPLAFPDLALAVDQLLGEPDSETEAASGSDAD